MWVTSYFSELISDYNSSGEETERLIVPSQTELNKNKNGCSLVSTTSCCIFNSASKLDGKYIPEGSLQILLKL